MSTQKALVIASPCHANWNKMSPTEKGKFCASCSKEVVDFRNSKKEDVIAYLESKKDQGQTCGQFSAAQIDKVGTNYINSSIWKRMGISFMALLGVFSLKDAKAQKPKMGKVAIKGDVSYQEYNQQNLKTDVTLFGSVRTSAGEKLSNAEIMIKSDGKLLATTKTMANGSFTVNLQVDKSMKALTLYTNAEGYDTKIVFIPEPQKPRIKVDIVMEEMILVLGEVMIEIDTIKTEVDAPEINPEEDSITTCTNQIENNTLNEVVAPIIHETPENNSQDSTLIIPENIMIDDKKFIKVFPNPATDNVTIEWFDNDENLLEVFDMNEKLIWSAKVRGTKTIFHASDLATGNYLVKITAISTGKSTTAQLNITR